jgi:hypothetical protein
VVSRTANLCIDAHDPRAQEAWWAQVLDDLRTDDAGWAVLADPEGNEFCVLATRADEARQ